MAMSHVQPILLLLASLFFIPALRGAVHFEYCDKNGNDYANVSVVRVSRSYESSSISVYVYGYASKNIYGGITFVYLTSRSGESPGLVETYRLCDVTICNTEDEIKAGKSFLLILPNLHIVGFEEEPKYSVSLGQKSPQKYEEDPTIVMCIVFRLPKPAATLVSS